MCWCLPELHLSPGPPYFRDLPIHGCDDYPETCLWHRDLKLNSDLTSMSPHTPKLLFHFNVLPLMASPQVQCQVRSLHIFTESSLNINLPIQWSNKTPGCFLYNSFKVCSISPIYHCSPWLLVKIIITLFLDFCNKLLISASSILPLPPILHWIARRMALKYELYHAVFLFEIFQWFPSWFGGNVQNLSQFT